MSASTGDVFQNSVYIGINIQNILYGIELLLYFKTIKILLTSPRASKKSKIFYACFSSMMLFSVTVWIAAQAIFGEEMWLLDDDFPGGPDEFWKKNSSNWYMDWGTTMMVILQLMTDGLMIYRCRVIYNNYQLVIGPIILWLASFVLGLLVDWITSTPGGDFFSGVATQLGLAYYSTSVFLNTTLTCMICYRIIRHGREVQEQLGKEYASKYFSVVTVVIESVLPYTLSGIACLVSLGIGSPTSVVFVCVYVLMMCISPQLLILRVIAGTAWDKDTFKSTCPSVEFSVGAAKARLQTISGACYPDECDKV